MPKLAALLLLLQVFAPSSTLNAQAVWTSRTSAADNSWFSVAYGNGLFVAVAGDAASGRVMTSPDGIAWTSRTPAANSEWTSVTYGNGLFVAVAKNGTGTGAGNRIMTSPDGIIWTIRPNTVVFDRPWISVTYGNGLFVAVAFDGGIMTSPDGINWTARASPASFWRSVTYGNNLFVAVASDGGIMTSPDGITWTTRNFTPAAAWFSVTYGNNLFVAVASNGRIMTSPDGINWTGRAAASTNVWRSVTYGNGSFVAVSERTATGNRVITSRDGITWTTHTSAANNDWQSVTYGNNLFVAVSNSGTGNRVMTSPSTAPTVAFNQTQPTCSNSTNGGLKAVATGGSGSFSYLWTPGGATTDTISNLAPGNYSVRVISGTDTVNQSVTLTAATVVAAPSTSNQSLCAGATVADLVATPSGGNTIVWYATATGGTALANSTPLVNATKYYAAQVTPTNCESSVRAVDSVTIQATVAAKADSSYCNGSTIAINFVGATGNTYAGRQRKTAQVLQQAALVIQALQALIITML